MNRRSYLAIHPPGRERVEEPEVSEEDIGKTVNRLWTRYLR
jgi:hypothetical protein